MCFVCLCFLCATQMVHFCGINFPIYIYISALEDEDTALPHNTRIRLSSQKNRILMCSHLQYLFMKYMAAWLYAEIFSILQFSSCLKSGTQNVYWIIKYTLRFSVLNVCCSGHFQFADIYECIFVPFRMHLVQTGI